MFTTIQLYRKLMQHLIVSGQTQTNLILLVHNYFKFPFEFTLIMLK